jgi:SET domain
MMTAPRLNQLIISIVSLVLILPNDWCDAAGTEKDDCLPEGTLSEEGVCITASSLHSSDVTEQTSSCPLWDVNRGWILSGHSINRYDVVPGLISDVMIPWKQHSARSFPRFGRNHYFFRNPNFPADELSEFIFAPGYKAPLECHKHHANLAVNYTDVFVNAFAGTKPNSRVVLNPPIQADRTISLGDPLFLPCLDPNLSAQEEYDKFPEVGMTETSLQEEAGFCINKHYVYTKKTDSGNIDQVENYYGTFAKENILKGIDFMWGVFVPIHRSELHDQSTNTTELLLNYCYAPNDSSFTSSILFLPMVPGASTINHADPTKNQRPNIAISWIEEDVDPETYFQQPSEILFGDAERSDKDGLLLIEYRALRDIEAGEELLLDYGNEWQKAWDAHTVRKLKGETSEFRFPIGLPSDMIPKSWLERERITQPLSYREWLTPTLQAGELQPIQLSVVPSDDENVETDTRQINGMVDRIGLPNGMSDFMANWAEEIGITAVLRAHVRGELTLPPEGERRLRLNGTTWWVKRFPSGWRSDMHYISPDDYGSNQMFMHALADAGFDTILNAVGKRDNLTSITVYYPAFIAVSHCTTAFMHNDSEEDGHYNVIFPVLQVNNSNPELIVGDDKSNLYAPYKYEPDHAVVLGKFGLHGTAPCDYRGTDSIRMVVSAYMLDGDNLPTRNKVIKDWIDADPPYPRPPDRVSFIENTKHWKRDDASRNLRNPETPRYASDN